MAFLKEAASAQLGYEEGEGWLFLRHFHLRSFLCCQLTHFLSSASARHMSYKKRYE